MKAMVEGFTEPVDRGFDEGYEVALIASMLGEERAVKLPEDAEG